MPAVIKTVVKRQSGSLGPLTGRVALVTGASRGIGRAIAERLALDGIHVFVNFRRASRHAIACVRHIRSLGATADVIRADVTHPAEVRSMFSMIERNVGRLDILVGNAGVAPVVTDPARVTRRIWDDTFATNVTGAFLCVQGAMPLLQRAKHPRIVFIGSAAARLGGTVGPHYAASKAALVGLVEYLSRALGKHGITVNLVEPGFLATNLSAGLHRTAAQRRRMRAEVPLGRIGTVDEVAAAVAFLASRNADYITRQRIEVTGGR